MKPSTAVLASHRELANHLTSVLPATSKILILGNEQECLKAALEECGYAVTLVQSQNGLLHALTGSTFTLKFDGVLVNDALAKVDDDDLETLLGTILDLLRPSGFLLLRENTRSSKGRNLAHYTHMLDLFYAESGNETHSFQFLWARPLNASVHGRCNWSDFNWLLRKKSEIRATSASASGWKPGTFRSFLDQRQYTESGISMYEWIFGEGFISPGGAAQNRRFLNQIGLKPGQRVLDVGCGIGGNALQMAEEFGVEVLGVDLSSNMIQVAVDKANLNKNTQVDFIIGDVTSGDFPEASFDVIYSRDCMIHIPGKQALFSRFYKWLKPGGVLLLTDYNVGEKEFSPAFKDYLAHRKYALRPIALYKQALIDSAFEQVQAIDMTDRFLEILVNELSQAEQQKDTFMKKFSSDQYDQLTDGWRNKLQYIAAGDHKWAMYRGVKDLNAE